MRYEISTLLALSQRAHIDIEKFSIQALGNNLLRQRQPSTSALSERPLNRSREVSNFSCRTEETTLTSAARLRYPSRQPKDPPQGTRAQTDAGFARFLKEHTSPRHQRVTAGGRIVPMDSMPPPPKMIFPTIVHGVVDGEGVRPNILSRDDQRRTSKKVSDSMGKNSKLKARNISKASSLPSGVFTDHTGMSMPHGFHDQQTQTQGLFPNFPPAMGSPAMFMQPNTMPFPLNNRPLHHEQTQEYPTPLHNYAVYGFGADQPSWFPNMNPGLNMQNHAPFISAQTQTHPSVSGSSSDLSNYSNFSGMGFPVFSPISSGVDSFYTAYMPSGQHYFGGHLSPSQPVAHPGTSHEAMQLKSLHDTTKEHEALSSQLSRLDRYMAIHSWDLDPQSKKSLVDQRMNLVRELDSVRLYKEQLESDFGQQKANASNFQREMPSVMQIPSAQFLTGDIASNQCFLPPQLLFNSANNADQTMSATTLESTTPSVLLTEKYSNGEFLRQSKNKSYSCDTSLGLGHMPTGVTSSYKTGHSHRGEVMSGDSGTVEQEIGAAVINQTETKNQLESSGGWTTPTRSAPPDIRAVYRKIEEATKRGDSIQGLLHELAVVTSQLVKNTREERSCSPVPTAARKTRRSTSIRPISAGVRSVRGEPSGIQGDPQAARLPLKRLWKSEDARLWRSLNSLRNVSYDTNEDDSKSCSSFVSTADSWATIEEGDKRWVQREMLQSESEEDEKSSDNGTIEDTLEQAGNTESKALNTDENFEGACDACDSPLLEHSNNVQPQPNSVSTKQACPQLLAQYFNKEHGPVSQKSAALAFSQNVNAHAYLRSFDGASDWPFWSDDSRDPENHAVCRSAQNVAYQHLNQESRAMYTPKEHVPPSSAVLREFFRRVEEEERGMIHQYQMMGIPRRFC